MSSNKTSIKFSDDCFTFLNNVRLNRIKMDMSEPNSYNESLELIAKYFKNHNDIYLEMLKTQMEEKI